MLSVYADTIMIATMQGAWSPAARSDSAVRRAGWAAWFRRWARPSNR